MKNIILSFTILFGTWLLLSGVYKTLIIAFGLFSVILTIFFVRRMDKFDRYQVKFDIRFFKFLGYFIWLLGEIAKSNIQVIKTILQGDKNINQKMFYKKATQASDIGKVIFANSITLTPGTISVSIEGDDILVHSLNFKETDLDDLSEMDKRITNIEVSN